MPHVLLVNGPNLNLLGVREPDIYGSVTLQDIEEMLNLAAKKQGYSLKAFQSNSEGKIMDFLQENHQAEGLIINPGAYTHYSYGIRDCIAGLKIPTVEIHMSQIYSREEFRHHSVIAPVCIGQISGFGDFGYLLALQALIDYFTRRNEFVKQD